MDTDNSAKSRGGTGTSKKQPEFSLVSAIHASEYSFVKDTGEKPAHQFEVILEPSAYSEEKYALYEKYQKEIHLDDDNRPSGFKRFLVESPLHHELMPYPSTPPAHLPPTFGSYHQLYRVDGELIAMGVIDILPGCVSSVYFMYDKKWEQYSLGKLSAMRETALAKEINDAGVTGVDSLYMGFYIHSCQKMRYKGEYSPSYLLDPEDYTWYPLSNCIPLLEGKKYASFAHPEHSIRDGEQVPGRRVAPTVSDDDLRQVNVVAGVRGHQIVVVPMNESAAYNRAQTRVTLLENIDALGLALSKEMIWYITPVGFVDDDDDEQEEKEKEEVEAKLVR
ncbi:hypothetical protein GLOTRDRAFT_125622 [Gloeophyllum trabeum ATCC 11539]|uniref:N-end rule aminoacyl transferase C-terminal domain-containing protein n=1 Tax=Gloeophyllum trabeum (strain ATCC 11539 / FP-39264 / Madison 617) TaxID=670483 RepID=S7QHP5_GLOTA|nr:uncharacterized protein GLOTRDRAFT_125622 [Gloeophyllum trabeum ATCC 11539]EPQ59316.1 hypothetical protein GLOTRDRAFT_125622 [Gloeophyllum trabeum ATCC 11539]